MKKQFNWLTKNIHGTNFNAASNSIPYSNISLYLKEKTNDCDLILAKGLEKVDFLINYLPHIKIVDMQTLESPNLTSLKCKLDPNNIYHCNEHYVSNLQCAKQIVKLLNNWIQYKILFEIL